MKIFASKQPQEQGSVLLITLILGAILLVASMSYMLLVQTQKTVVTHSQTWNAALPMAEAGVEEAMAQANSLTIFSGYSSFTNFGNTNLPPQDFSNNGWGTASWGGTNIFGPMARSLIGGSYSVFITTNNVTPTVYSTGYTTVPIAGNSIARAVKVTTVVTRLSNVGIGAVGSIDLNGNSLFANSWNSHDPNLSNQGQYTFFETSTNGDVASMSGLINVGNRNIQGDVYLGPSASLSVLKSGNVTGTIYNDFNVQFPDVTLPDGAASWPTISPITITTYTTNISNKGVVTIIPTTITGYNFTNSGNYKVISDYPIVVQPGITVAVNVTSTTLDLTTLQILGGTANSGTAVLYMNGPSSLTVSGNMAVGAGSRPENLWIFGLPSLTSIDWNGNVSFVGVIYAPEANITLNGQPGTGMMGSVIGGSITSNGNAAIHYDEYLANIGPIRGYVPASWQEY